jgi:lysophospholipid acyltransferase (LPLAT)-like uncharacterized protein
MKQFLRKAGARVFPWIVYGIMRILWYTTSKKFHQITPIDERQHICVTWHGELLMTPQAYRKIHPSHKASAIISQHFDGQIIAPTLEFLGIRPLRGSSKKGAKKVLLEAFRAVKAGEEVLITPDGPRGPRHTMSDGAIGLAQKSKLPVFIMNYRCSSYWQLGSWDRFVIPKPFSRIDFYMQSLSLEGMSAEEAKRFLHQKMMEHTIE